MERDTAGGDYEPPSRTFRERSRNSSFSTLEPSVRDSVNSLSVNYVPSKFSSTVLSGGPKRRKHWKNGSIDAALPKLGGGRGAFRKDESRMPREGEEDDEDEGGITLHVPNGRAKPRMRWNRFKWALFISNTLFTVISIAGFISCLFLWFNGWENADIIRVGNQPELIVSTVAAALGVLTALIGWSGILLNNRSFLAVYSFLLWICFALLVTPGYITYKKREFNLPGKLNAQWSRDLGLDGRLRIQNQLSCCGYFSPFVEATVSQTCYSRANLPGCKSPYLNYERQILERWYEVVFILVPVQITFMVTALLCSNHITYRFGKGMMPKAYRLTMNSMAVIVENYANQLAEQYGTDPPDITARPGLAHRGDASPASASSSFYGEK